MHPETRTRTAKKENSTLKRKTEGVKANQKKRFAFSSPWGPSYCSSRGVLWKEVEDYNLQQKIVILLGWAGIENPWETEAPSTACSEGSDRSDADENVGQTKRPDGGNENQTVKELEG